MQHLDIDEVCSLQVYMFLNIGKYFKRFQVAILKVILTTFKWIRMKSNLQGTMWKCLDKVRTRLLQQGMFVCFCFVCIYIHISIALLCVGWIPCGNREARKRLVIFGGVNCCLLIQRLTYQHFLGVKCQFSRGLAQRKCTATPLSLVAQIVH